MNVGGALVSTTNRVPAEATITATPVTLTATIAAGDSVSAAVDLAGASLLTLYLPAVFTGTTVTFLSAPTETGTYGKLKNSHGVELAATVAQGEPTSLGPLAADLASIRWLKIRSGTAAAPQVEAAERVITISAK